jgi:hypothetical protein
VATVGLAYVLGIPGGDALRPGGRRADRLLALGAAALVGSLIFGFWYLVGRSRRRS